MPLARAESNPAGVVAGLRERGELQQAEQLAAEQWRQPDLSPPARADLAIQMALLYTEQALAAPPESRDALWAKAEKACAALLEGWPENPRRLLVEIQSALVALARGEQARQWRDNASARKHLGIAARQFGQIADSVEQQLIDRRLGNQASGSAGAFSVAHLESLDANVSLQLARAQRRLGLCYAERSPDRDDALLQAVDQLSPLARRSQRDDVVWNARVELAACLSELGRIRMADNLAAEWRNERPPAEVLQRLSAVADRSTSRSVAPSEVPGDSDSFTASMSTAAMEYNAGRYAAAARRYEQLALSAPTHGRANEAHQQAILCLAELLRGSPPEDRAALAKNYERLLREHLARWPAQPSANEVRLWLARLLAARRDWDAASQLVREIPKTSPSFLEAIHLLVHCSEQQFERIDEDDEQLRAQHLAAVTAELQPIITGPDNRWPEAWSPLQREAAVAIARLHLRLSGQPSPYAERLLTAALRGKASAPASTGDVAWEMRSRVLLIESLARNGRPAEAIPIVDLLANASLDLQWETLDRIDEQLTLDSGATRINREQGELAMALVRLVEGRQAELDAAARARVDLCRAAAMAAVGDRAAAQAQYAALAAISPDDGELQVRYASFLAGSDASSDWRQALSRWQAVESRSRRGGPRWQRARRARIELLTRLGDTTEAEKLVRLTRLLYPGWDTDALSH